ncbi:Lateral signaling target protein 2 [Rhizophlyctis rosea]|uniref:Lateral signaling target protein 2 n=1 Tax=Rhizophlyctis rosea TaxID=64517 RepID=A0AAD5X586_9FUNG|nr:Lateral signaling target protein 2 [Rhizophlyctis rosea]
MPLLNNFASVQSLTSQRRVSGGGNIQLDTPPPRSSTPNSTANATSTAAAPAAEAAPRTSNAGNPPARTSTTSNRGNTNSGMPAYSVAQIFQHRKWRPMDHDVTPRLNETQPLSLFYHADEHLAQNIHLLKKVRDTTTTQFRRRNERVHQAQRLLLEAIHLVYSDMPERDKAARDYRNGLPPEDQRELEGGFSENILFAAQALSRGFRIRGIETFTAELVEPAKELCATLEALRFVFRCRALVCTSPPHEDLYSVLRDFDIAWTQFEKKICYCYFTVAYSGRPTRADETDMFSVLMSETIIRATTITKLLTKDQFHTFDPQAIIAVPRLTIIAGLLHMPDCVNMTDQHTAFRYFRAQAGQLRAAQEKLRGMREEDVLRLEEMLVKGGDGVKEGGSGGGAVAGVEEAGYSQQKDDEDAIVEVGSDEVAQTVAGKGVRFDSGISLGENDQSPEVADSQPSPTQYPPLPPSPSPSEESLEQPRFDGPSEFPSPYPSTVSTPTAPIEATNTIHDLFRVICSVADDLQSGPRAKEFVAVLHRVFTMHGEEEVKKGPTGKKKK